MVTIPGDNTTQAQIAVGGRFESALETVGDRDWVRLSLAPGETVQITMDGLVIFATPPLADPYLRLFDATGRLVAFNDDGGTGNNASLVYTADEGGIFYIEAGSFGDVLTGGYRLNVTPTTVTTPVAALDWGTALADTTVSVWLAPEGQMVNTPLGMVTSEGFNAHEQGQLRAVFDSIEAVSGLRFVMTDDPDATFRLILDTDETDPGILGYIVPPGMPLAGAGVLNAAAWNRGAGTNLASGGSDYLTLVQAILSGLGLAHPHDAGGSSQVMSGVYSPFGSLGRFGMNQGVYTAMSFNPGLEGTATTSDHGHASGPMALDIAVLQAKYGPNRTTRQGDDIYVLPDSNAPGTGWRTIWDTGGTDEIRYEGGRNIVIDLRAASLETSEGGGGFASYARGIAGGITIAPGVSIENATGGDGDDLIVGNVLDNLLKGGGGNDTIWGIGGNNVLLGGAGDDTIYGGAGRDQIDGGAGVDTMFGGPGDDTFVVRTPGDRVIENPGEGYDTILSHITLTLPANVEVLRLMGDENLDATGADGDDLLVGNSGRNILRGGPGNDILNGKSGDDILIGGPGADILVGEAGRDVFLYLHPSDSPAGRDKRDFINGFVRGEDLIDISEIDANPHLPGNQAFRFIGTTEFSGRGSTSAGELRYQNYGENWNIVSMDISGNGQADMQIFINLTSMMGADDFVL